MKIRNGFVSNSSSSSFIIVGYSLSYADKLILYQTGSQKEFDVIESDINMYVGKTIYYDEGFWGTQIIDKSVFDDEKVKKAAERFELKIEDAKIFVGEFER